MSLVFLALMGITTASAADVKTEVAKALMEAERANARVTQLKIEVDFGTCQQLPDTLIRNDNPWILIEETKRPAFADAQIKSCKDRFGIDASDEYAAWKARSGTPAATPAPTTSTRPAPTAPAATTSSTDDVAVDEPIWFDQGLVLGVGAGAGAMHVTGHEIGTPRLTSFLASTSVEARYSFGSIGIGVRATILPDLGGGMAFAGHLVPSMYVDANRAYVRVEPLIGYSFQEMGEEYEEDRFELGLSVVGRFAQNWGVRGTAIYGVDPDVANTPDNAGRFALEFVGEFATSRH